ncbi:MAG TPA: beta-galactosidase GalA [Prolixibacteraceae bacterium]|nr:beta-galactosidase GalA [Prolixibacteraceae bacterium]
MKRLLLSGILLLALTLSGISETALAAREHLLMDFGWKFSFGQFGNFDNDFKSGTGYFTWFAKTGYGDGPAAPNFDDRAWRLLDVPHDWAAELPFSGEASHSHGYKTVGWKYPESSVGWYRKTFDIPNSDLGRKISVQFDGVFRNSIVWVNGFYLGHEPSGYAGFEYDISDYLNYGGTNVITVRVDASIEEGWFYEGAGIYRHVWMNKTQPLHIAPYGIFASSDLQGQNAVVTARATLQNDGKKNEDFTIEQTIVDAKGNTVGLATVERLNLKPTLSHEYFCKIKVNNPNLWSPDFPYLYKLITKVMANGNVVDQVETNIGIRTLRFDANEGFFLNGKHLKLLGTNNHQDHAGVGCAIPDALQEFRIRQLKAMGSNAYRCSHNPPTPELLDACDKLGMLVLDENRLQGINQEHFDLLKRMMMRDRNHPSVIAWSLGNEEWAIESNIKGARITETMQRYAQTIDSTRRFTVAVSGGCGNGSSTTVDVMGFNYLAQCNIDEYHQKNPNQPGWGTEETSGCGTRGIYEDDKSNGHMAQMDRTGGVSIERGWKFYDERPWLAGLFYWTGFDYKGEPNPLGWPAVLSEFGIIDACGFPKDAFYYLKSWWSQEPVLHLLPHWNWKGKEGQQIDVWAYSNCDQVELFLNKKSLGKKPMPKDGHIEWPVKYTPGTLLAKGYRNGKEIIKTQVETTGNTSAIQLIADRPAIKADGEDISVVTVKINDAKGLNVPIANDEVTFSIEGPGKIIGVGNGDPASHEPDRFVETVSSVKISRLSELVLKSLGDWPSVAATSQDSDWKPAFRSNRNQDWKEYKDSLIALRGSFELPELTAQTIVNLFAKSVVLGQSMYINGKLVASNLGRNDSQSFKLDISTLQKGKNELVVVGKRFKKRSEWDEPNTNPGVIQVVQPADSWKRKAFNGLAQVIVQSTQQPGDIVLKATAPRLAPAVIKISAEKSIIRPAVVSN